MKALSLQIAAEYAQGKLVSGKPETLIRGVCTDSRKIQPGDLFVALKGEKFDGHGFVNSASESGAAAVMVAKSGKISVPETAGVIEVEDTLEGLQNLAGAYRRSLPVRIIGVTGSSGKSSTKELLASALKQKFRVRKTEGNFNNHIGVPLTLLSLEPDDEWAVVELGMNQPGEIEPLAKLIQPEIGVITNIGWTHVWTFPNRDAIAHEKEELLRSLPSSGLAVLNADDPRTRDMIEVCGARAVLAGEGRECTYGFENLCIREREGEMCLRFDLFARGQCMAVYLPEPAPHMARNAVLAAAVAFELGVDLKDIARGLETASLPPQRCAVQKFRDGWLIDDTYNASPDSMVAGFEMLRRLTSRSEDGKRKGRCIALLGAMGELGERSKELHEWVGKTAVLHGVEVLFAVGEEAKGMVESAKAAGLSAKHARWFKSHEALVTAFNKLARPEDKILVKGSRSQRMEKIAAVLTQKPQPKEGGLACCFI